MVSEPVPCPRCGSAVNSEKMLTAFPYGGGSHIVELDVELDVFTCACGEQFVDHRAETAKEEAVRLWLDPRIAPEK